MKKLLVFAQKTFLYIFDNSCLNSYKNSFKTPTHPPLITGVPGTSQPGRP